MSVMVHDNGRDDDDGVVLTDEQKRRRRARSIAIALALGALVAVFFVLTIVKVGLHPGRLAP
jgi:thiol:disulfide interchange protein